MDKATLQKEIVVAMKARDNARRDALRQVMQSVKNLEIDKRADATETDVTAAIKKNLKELTEEIEALEKAPKGREERLALLKAQAVTLESVLPAQVSGDELRQMVEQAIAEVGATQRRDTGKVMGWLTKATDGNFDKPLAAKMAGELLS